MMDILLLHVFQLPFLVNKEQALYEHQHRNIRVGIWCIVTNHYEYYNNLMDNQYMLFVECHYMFLSVKV
jgi:hypothetical protein